MRGKAIELDRSNEHPMEFGRALLLRIKEEASVWSDNKEMLLTASSHHERETRDPKPARPHADVSGDPAASRLPVRSTQSQAKPHTHRVRLPGRFLSKTLRHVHIRLADLKFANLSTIVEGARLDVPKVNFMRVTCSFEETEHVRENMHVPGTSRASTDPWWHDHDKVG